MTWYFPPISDYEKYSPQWDEINKQCYRSPILESRFFLPLLKYFSDDELLLAIYGDKTNPTAIAILHKKGVGKWETFQPSQAPIGAWIHKHETDLDEMLSELTNALPGIVLSLGITQQDPALFKRPENNIKINTLDYIETAHIPMTSTFDEYWSQRGKNLRQNIRRQQNKLEREKINTRLEIIKNQEEVKECIIEYGELESAGWKAQQGTAININNAQGKFYSDLLSSYAQTNQCYICKFYYDKKLVALDLCIEAFGTIVILKTTYDETQKTSSPALLMRRQSFVVFFDSSELKTIEFYGKVMNWHTKWSSDIRIMYHINYFPHWMYSKVRALAKGMKSS